MDFELTEQQAMIRTTTREFVDRVVRPQVDDWERVGDIPREIMIKMGEMGFLGAKIPKRYGGLGLDEVTYHLITEEIGRGCSSLRTAMSVNTSLFATTVLGFGTEAQKERYLPPVCSGGELGAWALTEASAGSDAAALRTTARWVGADPAPSGDDEPAADRDGHWVLNGSKMWISNGDIADYVVIFATVDRSLRHRGITAFVVEAGTDGFAPGTVLTDAKLGLHASHTAELVLTDCRLDDAHRIGAVGGGWKIAMAVLQSGRLSVAAGAVGIAQACLDASIEYAQEREAFGRPIAGFQLVQAHIAETAVEVEAARLLVLKAAALRDRQRAAGRAYERDERAALAVSMAKLHAARTVVRAADAAMQVLGALGYSSEHPVERYYRDARICGIYEGTNEIQKLLIGRALTGVQAFK